MGLYFVLILSVFTLCNVYAENYLGPTDESIKNKIRRGDLEEGFLEDSYVKCKWPTPPVHGYIVGPVSVDTGSIIHIACNHSYHLIGADTMQCQAVPNPFTHMALWFHQVGDMSYSDQPKCIKEIDPTPPNKRNNDYEEIKNQLIKPGRSIRPSNEIPGKSVRVPKQNVPESAKSMEDLAPEVSSPPPLSSQGRAKRESDDQILVEFEEEKEYEEMMEREDENDENNSESELLDGVNEKPEPNCIEPRSLGPCRASIPRYFFNKQSKNCEFFIYGGCRGNGNNFATKEDCEDRCKSYEKDDSTSNST